MTDLKHIWCEQMISNHDPRINWELGWKSICNGVKKIKRDKALVEGSSTQPEDHLFDLRLAASLNHDPEKISRIKVLEDEVRRQGRRSVIL